MLPNQDAKLLADLAWINYAVAWMALAIAGWTLLRLRILKRSYDKLYNLATITADVQDTLRLRLSRLEESIQSRAEEEELQQKREANQQTRTMWSGVSRPRKP